MIHFGSVMGVASGLKTVFRAVDISKPACQEPVQSQLMPVGLWFVGQQHLPCEKNGEIDEHHSAQRMVMVRMELMKNCLLQIRSFPLSSHRYAKSLTHGKIPKCHFHIVSFDPDVR